MDKDDDWTLRDVGTGLLFLVAGSLIVLITLAAGRNGVSFRFWGLGWISGPLLLLLGGNAVVRSIVAGLRERSRD